MTVVPIVFTFDNNLVMPAGVCITSLLENANKNTFYDIFILHSDKCDFSNTLLYKLQDHYKNCRITFRIVKDEFVGAYEIRGITTTAYYRFLIPILVPEYDKIFYSDVDVIFRDDLSNLYNQTDLKGFYFAATDNGSALRPDVQKYVREKLGIDHKYGHYYSGNLLINSELIRKDNIVDELRKLAKKKFHQQDMDILNIVCYGKIKPLPPAFCLTNYLVELIVTRKDEMLKYFTVDELSYAMERGIVHYNGPKPWKQYCVHFDIWWQYYKLSIFYDEKFYFNFFWNKRDELDQLSLWKRIKILIRYFVYGREKH